MKMNNKGFSLVEILAVVVILGVISTIGIVSVTRIIDNSRQHYYDTQNDSFIMAAQAYANDNRDALPKNMGGQNKIKMSTLLSTNYLKETIKDQDKNPCDPDKSYVKIFKKNSTDYRYVGYLNCPACNKNKSSDELKDGYCKTDSNETPDAKIELKIGTMNVQGKIEEQIKMAEGILEMHGDSSGTKELYSYSFKLYRDGALVYNSGVKRIKGQNKTIGINNVLSEFVPGKLRVVLTVTNEDGFTKTVSKTKNYNDVVQPHCGAVTGEGKTKTVNGIKVCDDSAWIKTPRRIFVECRDYAGSGCKMLEYAGYFTEDSKEYGRDIINIEDVSNKVTNCTVYSCIDRTNPELTVEVYKRINEKDDPNDYKNIKPMHTFTVAKNDTTIKDLGWYNANYPDGVFFIIKANDKVVIKSYKSEYNDSGLYRDNGDKNKFKNTSQTSDNNIYKLLINKTAYLKAEGRRYVRFTVSDGAGNITSISFKVEIDRTAPTLKVNYGRCGDKNKTNCANYTISNPSTITADNSNKTKTINDKNWISKGMQLKYTITDKNKTDRKWQYDPGLSMTSQGSATTTGHGLEEVENNTKGTLTLTKNGQRQGIITVTDAAKNSVSITVNVWVAPICTITYSPNGGKFNKNTNDLVEKVDYDSYVGDATTGLRNATGKDTFYQGTRDYYHTNPNQQWNSAANGSGTTFDEKQRYKSQNVCYGMTDGEDKPVTLYTNWKGNSCTITFDPNGGSFGKNAGNTTVTKIYPDLFGTTEDGLPNATGSSSYFVGTRDYYHTDKNAHWLNGTTVIDETAPHRYTTVQICGEALKTRNATATLKVNWKQNTCTVIYNAGKNQETSAADYKDENGHSPWFTTRNKVDVRNYKQDTKVYHKDDYIGGNSDMRNCQGGYYSAKWTGYVIDKYKSTTNTAAAQWRRFKDGKSYDLAQNGRYPVDHNALCPNIKTEPNTNVNLYVKWKKQNPRFVIHYWRHLSSKDDCNSTKSTTGNMRQQYPYRAYNYYQFFCECHYKESDSSLNTAEPYLKRHSTRDHASLDGKRTVKCGESNTWYYKDSTKDEKEVCFPGNAYIYYRKDKDANGNGIKACNRKDGDSLQINQYVYRVCTDGKVYSNHGKGKTGFVWFHGAHWYWANKATKLEYAGQKDYYYPHTGSYFLFSRQNINEEKGTSIMVKKDPLANDDAATIDAKYSYNKDKDNKMHDACQNYCTNIFGNPRHSYNDAEDDIDDIEYEVRDDED